MSITSFGENPKIIKYWRKNPKSIEKFKFVYHFLPHPEEKQRATFLSNKALFFYCLFVFLFAFAFRVLPQYLPGVLGYASNINVRDLLDSTNRKRAESGLSPLRLNSKLSKAAETKAYHMFKNDYWAHVSPDGVEPWDFILGADYSYIYAGENLAKNFSTSKEVVEAWNKSPSHQANLLSPNYDEIGFAVVNGVLDGYETTLVVQMFGRPRDQKQIASVFEEESVLEEINTQSEEVQPVQGSQTSVEEQPISTGIAKPKIDVSIATRGLTLVFGGFVGSLLTMDIWYSKRKGISKFTGYTFAHLMVLIVAIVSIWFVLKPGIVI